MFFMFRFSANVGNRLKTNKPDALGLNFVLKVRLLLYTEVLLMNATVYQSSYVAMYHVYSNMHLILSTPQNLRHDSCWVFPGEIEQI